VILKNHDLPFAQKEPNIREGFMADHYDDSWRVIIDGIRRKRGIFNRSKLLDYMKFYDLKFPKLFSYTVSIWEIVDKTCG